MRSSVAPAAPSSQFKSLSPKPAKASMDLNRPDSSAPAALPCDVVSLVFQCLAAVGLSEKEAAYTMALDPASLSRMKTGQQRLPIDAVWRLPDRFWAEFADRIGEAKNLTERHLLKVRAARIAELVKLLLEGV